MCIVFVYNLKCMLATLSKLLISGLIKKLKIILYFPPAEVLWEITPLLCDLKFKYKILLQN